VIIRGGFTVYSVGLEYLLLTQAAISEAAVVGVPDPVGHEHAAAYVVPRPGQTITARDVPSLRGGPRSGLRRFCGACVSSLRYRETAPEIVTSGLAGKITNAWPSSR
jgi:acyl-CoA synthetase (AMP-forming)/AMP-acid ligase II